MDNKDVKKTKNVSTKNKKGKFTLKRVKKIIVGFFRKIAKKVKELWNRFMALPEKNRYIIYVWSIILIVIGVLIVASNSNNEFLKDYQSLEKAMNAGALDYVKTYSLYPDKDNKMKLHLDFLEEESYVYASDIKDKSCVGFSLVHYDDRNEKYVISSYINCDKYTTEGYSDYK